MSNIISVARWNNAPQIAGLSGKFMSCDQFIRSKIIPPQIGSATFNFRGGKVTLTGDRTTVIGDDCEVVIRGNYVVISGCEKQAADMFISIHREIEEIRGHSAKAG